MMLEQAMQLLSILAAKTSLDEGEFGLKQSLSTYVEMQIRVATKLLEKQLGAEGFTEDDFTGYTPSSV